MKSITFVLTFTALLLGVMLAGCGSETKSHTEHNQHNQHQNSEPHASKSEPHAREVHLTGQQQNSLGIKVETLSKGSASSTISRPARIMYDLDRIAKVGPRIEAKVIRVLKDLGDRVEKGEPVALMSSVELGKAKADYIRLRAQMKSEEAHYKREQSLYEQEISSQAELLEAEAHFQEAQAELNAATEALRLYGLNKNDIANIETGSNRPLSYFYVTSPLDGIVQERHISPGRR